MTIPLATAVWIAEAAVERFSPHLERIEIAGSVRRKKELVGDIELVGVPYMNADLFNDAGTPILEGLRREILGLGEIVKSGDRYIRAFASRPQVFIDIFLVHPPAQWGSIFAIRTGPSDLSKYIVTQMRARGVRHQDGYAVDTNTGERVPTSTEEEFFALAGLTCCPPEHRDLLAQKVWE